MSGYAPRTLPHTNRRIWSIGSTSLDLEGDAGRNGIALQCLLFRMRNSRQTAASHMVMSGVDITTVREILRRKTIEMTLRYSHLSPDHQKSAVEALAKALKAEAKNEVKTAYTVPRSGMGGAGSQTPDLAKSLEDKWLNGAPGVTRTRDLLIRSDVVVNKSEQFRKNLFPTRSSLSPLFSRVHVF